MKSSINIRRKNALDNLEKQLVAGTRPVNHKDYVPTFENGKIVHLGKPVKTDEKGNIVYTTKKDGTKVPELLDVIPLTSVQIAQKEREIASLKAKLHIA